LPSTAAQTKRPKPTTTVCNRNLLVTGNKDDLFARLKQADARNGTAAEKIHFVMKQLTLMTAWPHQHTRAAAL
jgi:hypothetical protein